MATDNGRTFVQYVDDDGGEISLPGYLDARPSIVSPGDSFSILEDYAGEVLSSDRFVEVDAFDSSPHAGMTKTELAKLLDVDSTSHTKDELVSLADARARMFPPVPGATGDNAIDGDEVAPIPGQGVAGGTDDSTDTTEGDAQ